MALLCAEKRTIFMDCPVSGGVGAATAGTLSFMVGGPSDEMEAAKSVLEFMGAKVFPCGDVGTGQGNIKVIMWGVFLMVVVSILRCSNQMIIGTTHPTLFFDSEIIEMTVSAKTIFSC